MRVLCRAFAFSFSVFSQGGRTHHEYDAPLVRRVGLEFHYEYRTEDDLLMGSEALHKGFQEEVEVFHMDWVYTWKKEVRITESFLMSSMPKGKCRTARVESLFKRMMVLETFALPCL